MSLLLVVFLFLVKLILACVIAAIAIPFLLAAITLVRRQRLQESATDDAAAAWSAFRSSLYAGRVWHTRYLPAVHAFTYPLFIFCIDLEEVETMNLFTELLWPFSIIMNFRESDHLKNGEGIGVNDSTTATATKVRLSARTFRLISERTNQAFTPTLDSHRILLLTHLCYYGYCFNPVSFYYIQNKENGRTDAIVGEVSNTPWNEMHCYVLHEKSVDDVSVSVLTKPQDTTITSADTTTTKTAEEPSSTAEINYVFPKAFHVSPFMEMNYTYDWTFSEMIYTSDSSNNNNNPSTLSSTTTTTIRITNDMRKSDHSLAFRARLKVQRKGLHPMVAASYLAMYPVYCMIIQLWIHYQAFWLFVKGIAFQPHPQGSETAASKVIGNLMVPFFALQELLQGKEKTS